MYSYKTIIKKVIDGDTVIADIDLGFYICLRYVRIRLSGINAPDIKTDAGKVSRNRLSELLPIETIVMAAVKDIKKDKYNRILATLWLGDLNVNAWMLKEGLAEVWTK